MGNPMTPEQRDALKFQVLRALDGAGIGRLNWGYKTGIKINDRLSVDIHPLMKEATVIVADPFEDDFGQIATFTFDELFPELEWKDDPGMGFVTRIGGIFARFDNGTSFSITAEGTLFFNHAHQVVKMQLGDVDLAKETAQFIADQLAKAGRARKEAGS